MSLALDPTESAGPVEAEHCSWRLEQVPAGAILLEIRIHPNVIEGITRDIQEFPQSEVDGALQGRRDESGADVLYIERYQRLESAGETPANTVGFYRGTARDDGFPDSDGPSNTLVMTVLPDRSGALMAQFYLPGESGQPEPAEPSFPFLNRPHGKARRLVPDFDQAAEPVRPAREFFLQSRPVLDETEDPDDAATGGAGTLLRHSWPFLAALALIGLAVWLLPQVLSRQVVAPTPAPGQNGGPVRPLGLYVDPSSQNWRISWNRDASVLKKAQLVRLFVHDGDEQNGIDLLPADLESGMYQYQPRGNDVTFRMEATGSDGRVTAESFRLLRAIAPSAAIPAAAPGDRAAQAKVVAPQAIHRVAPVVAASIRPRIRGKVLMDIRVQVDTRGRVTSAVPVSRPHKGLETELTRSALVAARGWRFDPALKDGVAVTGTQTLHFVFEH